MLAMLKLVTTRWLSRGNCIERILTCLKELYVLFSEDSSPPYSVFTAAALVALLSTYKFVLALVIFCDILKVLTTVSKCFQEDYVLYDYIRDILDSVKSGFEKAYLGANGIYHFDVLSA